MCKLCGYFQRQDIPILGLGTWQMGENPQQRQSEVAALRHGLNLGMTLIDMAQMYGEGGAEEVVAQAISGCRSEVFHSQQGLPAQRFSTWSNCLM